MSKMFYDKLSLIKVSKGRCPKALDNFADFSVLCHVGRFTYAFCYQLLMIWSRPVELKTIFKKIHEYNLTLLNGNFSPINNI